MNTDKKTLLKTCLDHQEKQVERFEDRLTAIKTDISSQKHSPSQTEDRKSGKLELLNNYERELIFAKMEMDVLQTIKPDVKSSQIELGAIVITESINFFISVSIGKIAIGEEEFMGISTKAPIYNVMAGLEKNGTFSFNDNTYTIKELY